MMFFTTMSSVSLNFVQPLANGIFYGIYMGTCYTVIMAVWHMSVRPLWNLIYKRVLLDALSQNLLR
jgi:hypothetical protein